MSNRSIVVEDDHGNYLGTLLETDINQEVSVYLNKYQGRTIHFYRVVYYTRNHYDIEEELVFNEVYQER